MQLINIEPLQKEHWHLYRYVAGVYGARAEVMELEEVPIVDAVLVKHGRWEEPQPEGTLLYNNRTYAQCCLCKKKSYFGWKDNYCRYCGAKMDLEEQHDD